jgi:hypothetical protein
MNLAKSHKLSPFATATKLPKRQPELGRYPEADIMRVLLAFLAGWILWFQVGHAEKWTSAQSLKTRHIIEQPKVPIASQLRPDDEMVLVERAGFETRLVDTTVRSVSEELDLRARGSDVIAVAEMVTTEGILVNNDSWVRSKVTFRPLRVVKDSKQVIGERESRLVVFHDGGDVRINGVFVRAGYFYKYMAGARYLLFLGSFSKDNNAPFSLQMAVGPDNKLTSMELSTGRTFPSASPLYGLDLDAVIGELSRRLVPKTPQ